MEYFARLWVSGHNGSDEPDARAPLARKDHREMRCRKTQPARHSLRGHVLLPHDSLEKADQGGDLVVSHRWLLVHGAMWAGEGIWLAGPA